MAIAGTTETAISTADYNATAWANYADNAASPQTNIAIAAHSRPGTGGNQGPARSPMFDCARERGAHGGWMDGDGRWSRKLLACF
jgi:hypothetical protein